MKRLIILQLLAVTVLSLTTRQAQAQNRIAYISMTELIQAMPEFKSADTAMNTYQNALSDRYHEMVDELNKKDSALASPDTVHLSKEQRDVRRQSATELYNQIQGFSQQVNQLMQARQEQLLAPIRKKANDLIWELAKEHGYTYVLLKESIAVYPLTDDLMPYAKQKLGIK